MGKTSAHSITLRSGPVFTGMSSIAFPGGYWLQSCERFAAGCYNEYQR
jgi:hypothetical protein